MKVAQPPAQQAHRSKNRRNANREAVSSGRFVLPLLSLAPPPGFLGLRSPLGSGSSRLSPGWPAGRLSPGWPASRLSPGWPASRLSPGWPASRLSPGWPAGWLSPGWPAGWLSPGWPLPGWPAGWLLPGCPPDPWGCRSGRRWQRHGSRWEQLRHAADHFLFQCFPLRFFLMLGASFQLFHLVVFLLPIVDRHHVLHSLPLWCRFPRTLINENLDQTDARINVFPAKLTPLPPSCQEQTRCGTGKSQTGRGA